MNFGLYAAYLGMRSRQQQLDILANNIANASTSGFKADRLLYRSVVAAQREANPANAANPANPANIATNAPAETAENLEPKKYGIDVGVVTAQSIDFSNGSVRETGRSLDIALNGDGFLVVQTPRGERYTRQGSLTLDESGQLVTQQGHLVVGQGGPITVPRGEVSVGEDGSIAVNGQVAGQLKLVRFNNAQKALAKEGHSVFMATGTEKPQDAIDTRVVPGALEGSNVNSLTEMVAMMQNSREFESLQKSVSTLMNELGRKVANELGRI